MKLKLFLPLFALSGVWGISFLAVAGIQVVVIETASLNSAKATSNTWFDGIVVELRTSKPLGETLLTRRF